LAIWRCDSLFRIAWQRSFKILFIFSRASLRDVPGTSPSPRYFCLRLDFWATECLFPSFSPPTIGSSSLFLVSRAQYLFCIMHLVYGTPPVASRGCGYSIYKPTKFLRFSIPWSPMRFFFFLLFLFCLRSPTSHCPPGVFTRGKKGFRDPPFLRVTSFVFPYCRRSTFGRALVFGGGAGENLLTR